MNFKNIIAVSALAMGACAVATTLVAATGDAPVSYAPAEGYPSGFAPDKVSDVSITYNNSRNTMEIMFTTPTKGSSYDYSTGESYVADIPYLEKVEIKRSGMVNGSYESKIIKTYEMLEPGKTQVYTDHDLVKGSTYNYQIYAYFNDDYSWPESYRVNAYLKPAMIDDFKAELSSGTGGLPVILSGTTPATQETGEALSQGDITAIVLVRSPYDYFHANEMVEVGRVENPVPGEAFSFSDTSAVANDHYTYGAYALVDGGAGDTAYFDLRTGQDIPVQVTGLTYVNNHTSVTLSWDAVVDGVEGGFLNPSDITYTIYDYDFIDMDNPEPLQVLREGLTATTVTLDFSELAGPQTKRFRVTASSPSGEGDYANWPDMIVGPAATLPIVDNFNRVVNSWGGRHSELPWTIAGFAGMGSGSIYFTTYGMYYADPFNNGGMVSFTGLDGDLSDSSEEVREGMMGSYFDNSTVNTVTSEPINFKDVEYPVAMFYVFQTPASCSSSSFIEVTTSSDLENFKSQGTANCFAADENAGWKQCFVPLEGLTDADLAYIRLNCVAGDTPSPIFIDRFEVDNFPPVGEVKCAIDGANAVLTWENPSTATRTVIGYDVIKNGVKVNADPVETTSYTVALPGAGVTDRYTVVANYEGVSAPESMAVEVADPLSVGATPADKGFDVKGLDGMIVVTNPACVALAVYDVAGRLLATSNCDITLPAAAGVYIVAANGLTTKVIVK